MIERVIYKSANCAGCDGTGVQGMERVMPPQSEWADLELEGDALIRRLRQRVRTWRVARNLICSHTYKVDEKDIQILIDIIAAKEALVSAEIERLQEIEDWDATPINQETG